MKNHFVKIYIIIIWLLIPTCNQTSYSQLLPGDADEQSSEIQIEKFKSPYIALILKTSNLLDAWSFEIGGKILFPIFDDFSFGVGYYGLLTHNHIINPDDVYNPKHLRLNYGGFEIDYSLNLLNVLHLSISSSLGLGHISYGTRSDIDIPGDISGDWIFILEPNISINYTFAQKTSVGLGVGYRRTMGINLMNLNDNSLSSIVFSLILYRQI